MGRGARDENEVGSGRKTYYDFAGGLFRTRESEPSQNTITRKLTMGVNEGKEVHELHKKELEGRIIKVELNESNPKIKTWNFTIDTSLDKDKPEQIILQLGSKGGYASSFLKKLPNIDLEKDVVLRGYKDFTPEGSDKSYTGFSIKHVGEKDGVKLFYTKEDPNGLPKPKTVEFDGEEKLDFSEQRTFLEKMVNEQIKPKLSGYYEPAAVSEELVNQGTEEVDDLPF